MWQDTVIAICQLAFLPAMIPKVLGPDKPALSTSALNAVIVAIIASTMATLHLWFATTTGGLAALTWTILAVQKFLVDRRSTAGPDLTPATDVEDVGAHGSV